MGILSDLFGVTKAKQAAQQAAALNRTEANSAYGDAQQIQQPFYDAGQGGLSQLQNFLGLNGAGAQTGAFNNYQQSPDVLFRMQQGIKAIDNSSAARTGGTLSGGLLRSLQNYGTGVATQDLGNHLQRLSGVAGMGQNAANNLQGARYNTANLVTGANTNEGNAVANASLAGGSILGNLIGGGLNLAGNIFGAGGFNPFSRGGTLGGSVNNDPWRGIR